MNVQLAPTTLFDRLHDAWLPCFLWGMLLAGPAVLACTLVTSPVSRQRWMQLILLIWVCGSAGLIANIPEFQVSQGSGQAIWIGQLWLLGTCLGLMRVVFRGVKSYLTTGIESYPDREIWDWFRSERSQIGTSRITIRSSKKLAGAVAACRHRTVLVSDDFQGQMTESEARSILRHEIAHAKANHWLQWMAESLLLAIFFWHPVAWWMAGIQAESREMECDDVAAKPDRLSYAEALLKTHCLRRTVALAFTTACNARWRRLANPNSFHHPGHRIGAAAITACALLAAGWIAIPLFSPEPNILVQTVKTMAPAEPAHKKLQIRMETPKNLVRSSASASSWSSSSSWTSAGSSTSEGAFYHLRSN